MNNRYPVREFTAVVQSCDGSFGVRRIRLLAPPGTNISCALTPATASAVEKSQFEQAEIQSEAKS